MQIPPRLKEEIAMYLWEDMQKLLKSIKITKESSKKDVALYALSRGTHLGMSRAIEIINNWNKPNKGKVVARLN